jgi:probable F420-dependent oxidoreductase
MVSMVILPGGPRLGITIPFDGIPLDQQAALIRSLPDLGYTDVWSSETDGADAFAPLALASVWAPRLRLGTAIVPVYTRGPATLAQCAGTLAAAAPGRFVLGIGSSSDIIVEQWNSIPFQSPYQRTQDTVRFLRRAFAGERVSEAYKTFQVNGFRLAQRPDPPPPVLVAALRPGMLRLAGREADGAVINWLSADDVRTVTPYVHEGGPGKEVVARIFVAPTTRSGTADADAVRARAKMLIAAYLNVPVYRAFHDWLGRGDQLGPMWRAWESGDRKGAVAAVPDSVVDELVVHGTPEQCREHIQRYVDNGVTTPLIALLPHGQDVAEAVRALAPV